MIGLARRRRGLTLAEVLLALAVFATSFLALLGIFVTSYRSGRQARCTLLATHLAEAQMEASIGQSFSSLSGSSGSQSLICTANGVTNVVSFSWQIVVTSVSANLKDVRCQVSWTDNGTIRYINTETQVFQ